MQRVRRGEAVMVKVKDEENPSDFLTKHVPMRKGPQAAPLDRLRRERAQLGDALQRRTRACA